MNYNELKTTLLNLNVFNDCNWLDLYVDLIISNAETKKVKNYTERHHIIPKCYYKNLGLKINNSDDNLVNLVYCDHVLAHCYLALAARAGWFQSSNIDAIVAIFNNIKCVRNDFNYTSLEDFIQDFDFVKDILRCNHTISDSQRKIISDISSASKWYNNGTKESFTRFKPEGEDWVEGRLPKSMKTILKQSEANKGCHWYNDGVEQYFTKTPKEGWVRGRLDIMGDNNPSKKRETALKISKALKGRKRSIPRKCRCVETGQVFESTIAAAEWLGHKLSVDKACKEPHRTRGGYHWEYV